LPAKINLIQVALHIPIAVLLTRALGITGAALSVTILRAEDLIFYEWAARRAIGRAIPDEMERKRTAALWVAAIVLSLSFGVATWLPPGSRIAAAAIGLIGLAVYAWWCWSRVFSPGERKAWTSMLIRRSRIGSLPDAVPTRVEP
jgi:hypothetical protein